MEDNINELIINEAKKRLKSGKIKNNADLTRSVPKLLLYSLDHINMILRCCSKPQDEPH